MHGFTSRFSVFFQWSVCFYAKSCLITTACQYILKSGSVMSPAWFFFAHEGCGYLGISVVPYTFWDYFYSSLMNVIGIFIYLLILAF
jgi:hypothetical protein